MTAPDLPPCPVPGCKARPIVGWNHCVGESSHYAVVCYGSFHTIRVWARTKRQAIARWRRLAGEGK